MWSPSTGRKWPFAAMNPGFPRVASQLKLKGVVFDVDGTLCLPQNYMLGEMREALGIPKSRDILEHIESLGAEAQVEAQQKIRAIERRAMLLQTAQPGLGSLMEYLDSRAIRKGICTRNFDEPVNHLLTAFLPGQEFAPVLTRSFKPPKPDPAGILHIAAAWGEDSKDRASNTIMVGDSLDDMLAGSRAGAVTILLVQDEFNKHVANHEATDFCVNGLEEIIDVLEKGKL